MKLVSTLFLLGISSLAFSQNNISTEAPSVSASSSTIGKNVFQVESSFTTGRSVTNGLFTHTNSIFNMLRLGISDRFELRFINGAFFSSNPFGESKGFDPIALSVKYDFVKDANRKTHFALMANMEIPKFEGHYQSGSVNFSLSHQLNARHNIGANLGYGINNYSQPNSNNNNKFTTVNYSLIYNYQVLSTLTVFAETYGYYNDSNLGFDPNATVSYDIGVMYLLKNNIQIDYAFGTGIDTDFKFHSLGFNIMLKERAYHRILHTD